MATLTAPLAWATTLVVGYVLVARACSPGLRAILAALAASMLFVVGAAGFVSWRTLQRGRESHPDEEDQEPVATQNFLARLSFLSAALFAVAIVAQLLVPWMVHDCR